MQSRVRRTPVLSLACRTADLSKQPLRAVVPAAGEGDFAHQESIKMRNNIHVVKTFRLCAFVALTALMLVPGTRLARAADQKTFPSPNAAMAALIAAVNAGASDRVAAILGPELRDFIATHDKWENDVDKQ